MNTGEVMVYVIIAIAMVAGFILFIGIGKAAVQAYESSRINDKTARFILSCSMILWLLTASTCVTLFAFNIATWLGWIIGIIMAMWLIFSAFPALPKGTQHSIDLARERRKS